MSIVKIYVSNFRNFETNLLEFSPNVNIIVGRNGAGKSNILEAVYLLSRGKSFKTSRSQEMINFDKDLARVKGVVDNLEGEYKPEVVLTKGEMSLGNMTKKTNKKSLLIDGVGKRAINFTGNFRTVFFAPQDLDMIVLSPSIRRRFLDELLSQVDREYYRCLVSYEKGLRQRNKLLFAIRELGAERSQLIFWDKLLIKNGDYISRKREDFLNFANDFKINLDLDFSVEYDRSAISEARLAKYAHQEVSSAMTLVGPHRDDIKFKVKNEKFKVERDLDSFGSRGEQRMGVLWIKLAELAYVEKLSADKPVLLLDDIFSELDHEHRKLVMDATLGHQTIITTADAHFVEGLVSKEDKIIKI